MWIVAGVLLGSVIVASLVGFHAGPHAHVGAGVIGALAGGWLVFMSSDGKSAPLVWVLFSADIVISAGIVIMGWTGLRRSHAVGSRMWVGRLEGAEGVAVTDLKPDGIVRVGGEQWSASSANGTVTAGSRVQVLRSGGVRLEVWGECPEDGGPLSLNGLPPLVQSPKKEQGR